MAAFKDPAYKATYRLPALGHELTLQVPHDVFSTQKIDDGTLLLLENLPAFPPERALDMGCGYGALGLPIARHYPACAMDLVDRDLLAVHWAQKNAEFNHIPNAHVLASLDYGSINLVPNLVEDSVEKYDWILCNIPARIGRAFIEYFFTEGLKRLSDRGEIRVVVILDLCETLESLGFTNLEKVASHKTHAIYSLKKQKPPTNGKKDLYLRDEVEIGGLTLERPFDLGGDDPLRIKNGLPLLWDALPRQKSYGSQERIFSFRIGYGAIPLQCRKRWPDALVTALDRDLLAANFTQRNADRLGLSGGRLQVSLSPNFFDSIPKGQDLILGEISPSLGQEVAHAELNAVAEGLQSGGQALLLSLEKTSKAWIENHWKHPSKKAYRLLARDNYVILSIS